MPKLLVMVLSTVLYSCSVNNTKEDDSLAKYFDANHLQGTFALFNNGTGEFTVYNMDRYRDSVYLPASTFKIVNSLIGIETGIVKDSATVIPWDGITRKIAEWNRDLNMHDAFTYSCVPWFQELARRIGRDTMQHWLDTLGYAQLHGKPVITNNLDTFWLDNSIKVTADEQLGLVKKLYFGQLPFQSRSQRMVKNMMLREDNANYKLSYKTGLGITEKKHALGWIIGWIEENRHPFFFVLQLESSDPDYNMSEVRLKMLKDILHQYGFMEGKR
ncbi:MAG TPA: penicillin-binding transpeptidase domain-containing protein [Flavitalea sp.]|nr:penicillin-binding transpeptidase domain-containing protein [Flavitalea sp.]